MVVCQDEYAKRPSIPLEALNVSAARNTGNVCFLCRELFASVEYGCQNVFIMSDVASQVSQVELAVRESRDEVKWILCTAAG
jgi:hypothetical protein